MHLTLRNLTPLQQELLQAARLHSPLRRARGGYVSLPGAKPFTVRTVMALQRLDLLAVQGDGAEAEITASGSQLLLGGAVEVHEDLAG